MVIIKVTNLNRREVMIVTHYQNTLVHKGFHRFTDICTKYVFGIIVYQIPPGGGDYDDFIIYYYYIIIIFIIIILLFIFYLGIFLPHMWQVDPFLNLLLRQYID